ncbi:MAG: hypothetical protein R3F39_24315 [Myxococcota bacterium]
MKRFILAVSLVLLGVSPALAAGPPAPTCDGLDLLATLSGLSSTPTLKVTERDGRLTVTDLARARELFTADCTGVHPPRTLPFERPLQGEPARTLVQKDRQGDVLYTVSATANGATIWTFAAGGFAQRGLHVAAFGDLTLTVQDGEGALVYSRTVSRDPDDAGTLIEREGHVYGCGCERTVTPDGRAAVRKL